MQAVREMLAFVGRTVAKRTLEGQRQSVEHEAYICHCYNRGGLIGLTFVGKDYPSRAAFSVVNKVMDEFTDSKGDAWKAATADTTDGDEIVNAALQKYQDPHEADKLLKIQRELDETKVRTTSALSRPVPSRALAPVPPHAQGADPSASARATCRSFYIRRSTACCSEGRSSTRWWTSRMTCRWLRRYSTKRPRRTTSAAK